MKRSRHKVLLLLGALLIILACKSSTPPEPTDAEAPMSEEVAPTATNPPAEEVAEAVIEPPEPAADQELNIVEVESLVVLAKKGGRLALSPDGTTIAYDRRGRDGFYDIWTMSVQGDNQVCLTCDHPTLPTRNVGQPDWHPSGDYLIVQVEKQEHPDAVPFSANPGAGIFNDLWIIDYQSERAWLVHEVPDGKHHGVLHPHFSSDGTKLSWGQIYRSVGLSDPALYAGSWQLMVAEVVFDAQGVAALEKLNSYQPGDEVFYENHGFSPDGEKLIFTSNLSADESLLTSDIHTLDLATGTLTTLTTHGYNEHAQYSPDGSRIIWMTTTGNLAPEEVQEVAYTDWWIMKADGSGKQ